MGVVLGLIGIVLGVYVSKVWERIQTITSTNKDTLETSIKIKEEINQINENIHNDIESLYKKLQREETKLILTRLHEIPEDIANASQILLTRNLLTEDYFLIKSAYKKLQNKDHTNFYLNQRNDYLVVIFQHFLGEILVDDEMKNDFEDIVKIGVLCAFEVDMRISLSKFSELILKRGINVFKNQVESLFRHIASSKFKNNIQIYESFLTPLYKTDFLKESWVLIKKSETNETRGLFLKIQEKYELPVIL